MIKKITTKKEYLDFVQEVKKHDKLYYQECKPEITDYEYDQMVKELQRYEKENPQEIDKRSPTSLVGEKTTKGFKQAQHTVPMLSLANTYSEEEVQDYVNRIYKLLNKKDVLFCCELKMDGTAVSIRYEKGKLVRAVTRGTGTKGDIVTPNIRTIKSLPDQLKTKAPDVLEIRGEVFMSRKTFQDINKRREEEGLDLWANPRNAAAGSLKLLNHHEVEKRNLDIVLYSIAEGDGNLISQFEVHRFLKKLGLPVSDEKHYSKCHTTKEIFAFADKILKLREKLSFEIDGIVIKVDDISTHKKLGRTGKSPRYAVAYKFAPEQATTEIEDITVQVGRTGVLTPVAELKPVQLAGSKISRATLHNEDEVKRLGIHIGDTVLIEKGGDVIPKVVKVEKRKKDTKPWQMPKKCPICKTDVVRVEKEVAVRCPNPKCTGQKLRSLIFFASKHALDIENLGEKVVQQLVDKGFIARPSDIYILDKETLSQLEGFKEKSINNLLESIEKSRDCTLAQFIMGLEIKYVGKETAELLAEIAGDIKSLEKMKRDELIEIEGVGEKVADSIVEYFQDEQNLEEIDLLLKHGVTPKAAKKKIAGHEFSGKVFVLTGSLEKFTRDEAAKLIKERGGKTSSSVSQKTDFVLVGESPGSKYKKAQKLNIKTISEEEFEKML